MPTFEFYQLDVFTRTAFQGNPLAVFPAAEGISGEQMQKIALEMNLSETVFVLSSDKALKRLRIFTPKQELPLAGHPVAGTWNLLAQLGVTPQPADGNVEIERELNLGALPVEIVFRGGRPVQVTITQDKFQPGDVISDEEEIEKLARGLGLAASDLNFSEELPIRVVSTGVRSFAALRRCLVNPQILTDVYRAYGAVGCYPFTFETLEAESKIHARFFAPDDNIPEDPATGSAAGALAGYLIHYGAIDTHRFTIEQGDFMNRPSRIFAEATGNEGNVQKIKIGGPAIVVAKGELYLD